MRRALALVFQRNDIYSGLGDDSSTTLDAQGNHEQSESQKARCEAKESDASENIKEESTAGGGPEPRGGSTGDPHSTVHLSADVADQPLGTTEERYFSNMDA